MNSATPDITATTLHNNSTTTTQEPIDTIGLAVTPYVSNGDHHAWIIAIVIACVSIISIPVYLLLRMCWIAILTQTKGKIHPEPYETISRKSSSDLASDPPDKLEWTGKPTPEKSEYVMLLSKQADPQNPQPVMRMSKSRTLKSVTIVPPADTELSKKGQILVPIPPNKATDKPKGASSSPPLKRQNQGDNRTVRSDPILHPGSDPASSPWKPSTGPSERPGERTLTSPARPIKYPTYPVTLEEKISDDEVVKIKPIVYNVISPPNSRQTSKDRDPFKMNQDSNPTRTLGNQEQKLLTSRPAGIEMESAISPLRPGTQGEGPSTGSRRISRPATAGNNTKRGSEARRISPSPGTNNFPGNDLARPDSNAPHKSPTARPRSLSPVRRPSPSPDQKNQQKK